MYPDPTFNYLIVDDSELPNLEGLTLPQENLIKLRESVYYDAVAGKGRARFSVCHEVSHFIQLKDCGIALARPSCDGIPAYRNPEWQANTLTSEILIPPRLSVGMSAEVIAETFGVSLKAAKIHLHTKSKEGLP